MNSKFSKFLVLIAIFWMSFNFSAQAQTADNSGKTQIAIETDPSTFGFAGYAVHVRIKPQSSKHLVLGAGVYAMDFPDLFVAMNPDNKDMGWKVRIQSAYAAFGEYYLQEANSKWFVGMQIGVQNYRLKNDSFVGKSTDYSNLLVMPSVGYTWKPFSFPLYLKPWAGVGYTSKVSGENQLETMEYKIAPLVPFVTLHVGYIF